MCSTSDKHALQWISHISWGIDTRFYRSSLLRCTYIAFSHISHRILSPPSKCCTRFLPASSHFSRLAQHFPSISSDEYLMLFVLIRFYKIGSITFIFVSLPFYVLTTIPPFDPIVLSIPSNFWVYFVFDVSWM